MHVILSDVGELPGGLDSPYARERERERHPIEVPLLEVCPRYLLINGRNLSCRDRSIAKHNLISGPLR